ncbi:unnamed protein product [Owenia fusiformis]|uniref:Uncharacterized protein n=1 Tax=Owenia fusiformis TaxID=6347 RepID=A0A8J1TR73_OWEFU|nr:unnamed protein product [Owenia fusiformis]
MVQNRKIAVLYGLIVLCDVIEQSQGIVSSESLRSNDNQANWKQNTTRSCTLDQNITSESCTATGTCINRCGESLPEPMFSSDLPACSCDKHCVNYKDCCSDFITECPAEVIQAKAVKDDNFEATCIKMENFDSWVISYCAAGYTNTAVIEKCKSNATDPISRIPAYDRNNDIYYKNIYCALCSGVTSISFWDTYGICSSELMINSMNMNSIESILDAKMSFCTLYRFPNIWDDSFNVRYCAGEAINECEEGCTDPTAVELCNKGYQQIVSTKTLNFKNEYCARCNPSLINKTQAGIKCGIKYDSQTDHLDLTKGQYNYNLFMYYNPTNLDKKESPDNVKFEFYVSPNVYDMGEIRFWCNILTNKCKYTACATHYKLVGEECRLKDLLVKIFVTLIGDLKDFNVLLVLPLYGPLKHERVANHTNVTVQIMLPQDTSIEKMNDYMANITTVIEGCVDAGVIEYTLPENDTVIETPVSPYSFEISTSSVLIDDPTTDDLPMDDLSKDDTSTEVANTDKDEDQQENATTTGHTTSNKASYIETGQLYLIAIALVGKVLMDK